MLETAMVAPAPNYDHLAVPRLRRVFLNTSYNDVTKVQSSKIIIEYKGINIALGRAFIILPQNCIINSQNKGCNK